MADAEQRCDDDHGEEDNGDDGSYDDAVGGALAGVEVIGAVV